MFMKHIVVSIYDSKAGFYLKPMFFKSKGEAIRSFSDEVNSKESYLAKHCEDFVLFDLGTFDDVDCKFDLHDCSVSIGKAIEFLNRSVDVV